MKNMEIIDTYKRVCKHVFLMYKDQPEDEDLDVVLSIGVDNDFIDIKKIKTISKNLFTIEKNSQYFVVSSLMEVVDIASKCGMIHKPDIISYARKVLKGHDEVLDNLEKFIDGDDMKEYVRASILKDFDEAFKIASTDIHFEEILLE